MLYLLNSGGKLIDFVMAQVTTVSLVECNKEKQSSALVKNTKCSFEWTTKVKYNENLANLVNNTQSRQSTQKHIVYVVGGNVSDFATSGRISSTPVTLVPKSNSVLSPVFSVESDEIPLQFRLDLHISSKNDFINAYASMPGNGDMEVLMNLNLNLLSANQNSLWIAGTSSIFSSNLKQTISGSFGRVWTPLLKEPVPVNFPNKVLLYKLGEGNKTDTIFIRCEIKVYDLSTIQPRHSVDFTSAKTTLLQNLSSLYKTQELSDFVIQVKGTEFRAHKAVLGMSSPVFASMFQQDMLENNQNCVNITDFDAKTIDEMLRFIYTGESKLDENMAENLLALSDKYAIDSLKTVCEDFLMTNITVETVLEILNLADMHVARKLKERCVDFICDHAPDVINTASWKNISVNKPYLIVEVFTASAMRQKSLNNS